MARTAPVMTRIEPKTKKKLQTLARNTNRSEAYLVSEAIENYVAANEWQVALIKERLAEAKAGGPTLTHEEVVREASLRSEARQRVNRGTERTPRRRA